jgi:hypothetical protein
MITAPIKLTLRASTDELLAVSGHFGRKATHRGWLRGRSILASASGPLAAGIFAAWLDVDVGHAILLGAVAASISLGVDVFANQTAGSRYKGFLRDSAFRQRPTEVTLDADGFRIEASDVPWTLVREVRRWEGMTLLRFSPVDCFVIRDADLPEGLSPDDLMRRIAEWQSK